MIDSKVLGKRIKFFRERAHMSQFALENTIGASAGMMSRIESGQVNPTKETVNNIARILKLTNKQVSYLIGPLQEPASDKEIKLAINEVKDYFSRKDVFAYMIDDRFRFVYVSEGFVRLFNKNEKGRPILLNDILNKSLLTVTLDNKYRIAKYINWGVDEDLMNYQMARFKSEADFMFDDQTFRESLGSILKHPIAGKAWEHVQTNEININSIKSKTVPFKFGVFKITLKYSREPVAKYPRFETIEYFPTIKLFRFLSKFI